MSKLVSVPFHGQTIPAVIIDGQPHVALKPISENIGLDWDAQRQRIKRHPVLHSTAVMTTVVAEDGKRRKMLMLPLAYLNGWLFGVDTRRVKPDIRERLVEYQQECYMVLSNHFIPSITPLKETQVEWLQNIIASRIDHPDDHQGVLRQLGTYYGVDDYKEISSQRFPDVLLYIDTMLPRQPNAVISTPGVLLDAGIEMVNIPITLMKTLYRRIREATEAYEEMTTIQARYNHAQNMARDAFTRLASMNEILNANKPKDSRAKK